MISLVYHIWALVTLSQQRISNLIFFFHGYIMEAKINLYKPTFKVYIYIYI